MKGEREGEKEREGRGKEGGRGKEREKWDKSNMQRDDGYEFFTKARKPKNLKQGK